MTEENRPDPGLLLKKLQYEEKEKEKQTKGKLKIFLGYAAGSGKTYAMLEAAHEAKKHQVDVVAGYIEPHARPDTQAMAEGLEEIPPLMVDYKGIQLREFNLDAALERKPKLILVDELAHTNVRGSRNEKRYQDVRELLRAGINVYTTMNIQHLESLNDLVGNITNIEVKERVPDSVFDQADQVEVIDIEPEDLIERMKEGKIYGPVQAERALENFFPKRKAGGTARNCTSKKCGPGEPDCGGREKYSGKYRLSYRRTYTGMYFRCAIQRQGDPYSSQTFLCFSCPVYGTLCGNTCHAGSGREDETNLKKPSGTGKGAGSKNRNGVW